MFGVGSVCGDLRFSRHDYWNAPSYASFHPGRTEEPGGIDVSR
jgi:hypothetical protein